MTSARGNRLANLTAMRGLAAFVVFGFHANYDLIGSKSLNRLTAQGISGVSFFFILSGFVLMWSGRTDRMRFWQRRAARILPLYYLAWFAALVMTHFDAALGTKRNQLVSLTLLQSWSHHSEVYYAGNRVAWSLSCEAFFYLLFPFVAVLVARARVAILRAVLAAAMLIAIVLPVLLYPPGSHGTNYWIYIFPPTRLVEFLIGVLAAQLVRTGGLPRVPLPYALGATVALYVLAGFLPYGFQPVATTVLPYTALIVAVARAADQVRSRFAHGSGRSSLPGVLVRLGEWSYAFYLFHQLVLRLADRAFRPFSEGEAVLITAGSLVVAVALAGLLCEWVEKPLERRLRGDQSLPQSLQA